MLSTQGGGIRQEGGIMTLSLTLVDENTASTASNIAPVGGSLYYALPAPAGFWLPATECFANREPCDWNDDACNSAPCSTTSGSAPDWTPSACKAPVVVQS